MSANSYHRQVGHAQHRCILLRYIYIYIDRGVCVCVCVFRIYIYTQRTLKLVKSSNQYFYYQALIVSLRLHQKMNINKTSHHFAHKSVQ